MKRELDMKEKNLLKICKKRLQEFLWRKIKLKRNMTKKERLLKILNQILISKHLKTKEIGLFYLKNTRIWKHNKKI